MLLKKSHIILFSILFCLSRLSFAETTTKRSPQLSNQRVNVWQTVIYPSSKHILKRHRHDNDRVVVALSNGLLKITNDHGKIHYLKLEQGKSYYLQKDPDGLFHTDENISSHAIKVVVVELK